MKYVCLFIALLLTGCQSTSSLNTDLQKISQQYFSVYAKRQDFAALMAFYADNATFDDMIYGNQLTNKQQISDFLNWHQGDFTISPDLPVLEITSQVISGKEVVTQGYFNAFTYNGHPMGPWHFVIWQQFNPQGLITAQTDWINYTPRADFLGGKNLNLQLPSSINR